MNVKRIFGTILTILGIVGLIYTGNGLIHRDTTNMTLIVVGVISLLFFFSGIGLIKNTKDEG
ncbi:MAG: hypothetical protein LBJ04_01435 [Sphingobacterium sp.]|jgi:uncharacterized membrane protein|uniref:hypothetical protein n=1 Tax=Sphingobacterium sp. TaxID=341027 RepID=UPI0028284ED4|nr:hypothetical protein [Sphingobacterium sp.]